MCSARVDRSHRPGSGRGCILAALCVAILLTFVLSALVADHVSASASPRLRVDPVSGGKTGTKLRFYGEITNLDPTWSIARYTWDFGDSTNPIVRPPGAAPDYFREINHTFDKIGTYHVTFTVDVDDTLSTKVLSNSTTISVDISGSGFFGLFSALGPMGIVIAFLIFILLIVVGVFVVIYVRNRSAGDPSDDKRKVPKQKEKPVPPQPAHRYAKRQDGTEDPLGSLPPAQAEGATPSADPQAAPERAAQPSQAAQPLDHAGATTGKGNQETQPEVMAAQKPTPEKEDMQGIGQGANGQSQEQASLPGPKPSSDKGAQEGVSTSAGDQKAPHSVEPDSRKTGPDEPTSGIQGTPREKPAPAAQAAPPVHAAPSIHPSTQPLQPSTHQVPQVTGTRDQASVDTQPAQAQGGQVGPGKIHIKARGKPAPPPAEKVEPLPAFMQFPSLDSPATNAPAAQAQPGTKAPASAGPTRPVEPVGEKEHPKGPEKEPARTVTEGQTQVQKEPVSAPQIRTAPQTAPPAPHPPARAPSAHPGPAMPPPVPQATSAQATKVPPPPPRSAQIWEDQWDFVQKYLAPEAVPVHPQTYAGESETPPPVPVPPPPPPSIPFKNQCRSCRGFVKEGQALCSRCSAQAMMVEVQKELATIQAEGINIVDARSLFEEAVNDFDLEQFEKAKRKLAEVHDKIEINREMHFLARTEIEASENEIATLNRMAIQAERAQMLLQDAKASMMNAEYDLSMEKAKAASKASIEAREEGAHQTMAKDMRRLEEMSNTLAAKGLDVSPVRKTLARASEEFQKRAYGRAMESATAAKKQLREVEIEFAKLNLDLALVEALSAYAQSRNRMNLGLKELVHQTGSFFDRKDYARSGQMAQDVITVVRELCPEIKEVLQYIEKAGKANASLARDSPDVVAPRGEYYLNQSLLLLAAGNLLKATEAAEESNHSIEKALTQHRQAQEVIRTFELSMERANQNGVDTTKASEYIAKARFFLSKGLYRDVIEQVRLSEKALTFSKEQMDAYQEIMANLRDIELSIKEAKRKNLDLSKANYFVDHAKAQLEFGRFDRAQKYMDNALLIIRKLERTAKQTEEILKMYSLQVKSVEGQGYDVTNARKAMDEAFQALSKGLFGVAIGYAKEADRYAQAALASGAVPGEREEKSDSASLRKQADVLELYTRVEANLSKATVLGIDTSEIDIELGQVKVLVEKKELDRALEVLKSIDGLMSGRIRREMDKKTAEENVGN